METQLVEAPAAITEKVTLGQKITFTATLERKKRGRERLWKEVQHKERNGIVVGSRTLWDGEMYTEDGCISFLAYHPHLPALLVAFALNRKPVLVPLAAALAAA